MSRLSTHTKRLFAAICLVAFCLLAVPCVQIILDTSQVSRAIANDSSSESQSFAKEVCNLDDLEISNFSEECDGKVIGFNMSDNANSSFQKLSSRLIEQGWSIVSSGSETIATFVKSEGVYTWLLLQATDVGNGSCVTITLN